MSFEDDAVFAEYREEGTDSTAATSERGSEECEEAEAWGLNEEDETGMAADVEGLPFEDDFDDFPLDRPTKPLMPDLLLPHPSRNTTASIIDFDAHSSSGGEDTITPRKESHLINESPSPVVSAPSSSSSSGTSIKKRSKTKKKAV